MSDELSKSRISKFVPSVIKNKIKDSIKRINTDEFQKLDSLELNLESFYKDEISKIEKLIGREIPIWKKIKSVLIVTSAEFTPDQGGPGRFIGELYKSLLNRDIKYFQSYSFNLPNNLDTFEDNLRIAKQDFGLNFRDVIYFIPVIGQFSYLAKLYFVSKKN